MRFFIYSLLIISTLTSCKSEFEQVRISNDPARILKTSIKYYDAGDYLRAQTLMELILNQFRGTSQGEELFFKYAYTHFHLANYELAATYFTNFTTTFGYSSYTEEADYMIAYSYYKQSPSFRLDQDPSIKAIDAFQDFANKYPQSDRVPECNKLIDELRSKLEEKAYAQGQLYYDLSQYQAAVTSFKNMLSSFPESSRAENIRFLILKASYEYAARSVYAKRAERYEEAKTMYTEYMNRYPKGPHAKDAREINKQIQSNSKNLSK
ncbi:MAG: outer membrane protein assembly factor BamD [Saprospiraceae bacterium]|uniref:Outer membrane protein assembly factor BamD n=1 Tax=Candidatus Opimibacter skivensis TaxID=2982028 RepID=A0A9D7STA5_9BACT|nr:outer membrane protein assembly factor BamD [Candidatus Opimibacter skivensis]